MTIAEKYERIIISKLPREIAKEINQIAQDTENFADEDIVEVYKENFNNIYAIIEKKYPESLKPKAKLKTSSSKKPIVKKAQPKKQIIKKSEPKKVLKKTSIPCDEAIATIKKIEKTKAEAVAKRAEAPKKRISTSVREKLIKAISSSLKIKNLKEDKEKGEKFVSDIILVYKKYGFTDLFISNLKEDFEKIINERYKIEKLEQGGSINKVKKNKFTILAFNEEGNEIGYWFGANNTNPNDSIGGGDPFDWGDEYEANKEIENAKYFAENQGWTVSFGLEKLY